MFLFENCTDLWLQVCGKAEMRLVVSFLTLLSIASANKVPVILEHPRDMTVARNEPVTLNCKVNMRLYIIIVVKSSESTRGDILSG